MVPFSYHFFLHNDSPDFHGELVKQNLYDMSIQFLILLQRLDL